MDITVFFDASGHINTIPISLQVMADGKTQQLSVDKDNKKQDSIPPPPTPLVQENAYRKPLEEKTLSDSKEKAVANEKQLDGKYSSPPFCSERKGVLCDNNCFDDPKNQICRATGKKLPGRPGLSIPDVQPGVPINLQLRITFHPDKTIEVDVVKQ